MKKIGVFVAVFALIIAVFVLVVNYNVILTGNVVYDNGCDANQTIFRIYSLNNSHGEKYYGTGNYQYRICYPSIFGVNYNNEGSDPHTCAGGNSNLVIRLSNSTNAHGESPSLANYTLAPICFGDMSCTAKATLCNDSLGEKFVVALSSYSNAHISADVNSAYPIKICCTKSASLQANRIVVNITSPKRGEMYFANGSVVFDQKSYGPNGYNNLTYLWDLGDGNTRTLSSFSYSYARTGPKIITLKVTDQLNSSNYGMASVEINILKLGLNVYPLILTPADLSVQSSKVVQFNGSESYVVNVTNAGGVYKFECLGGGCPISASGYCGNNCPGINDSASKRGDYSNMSFSWSFGIYTSGTSGNGMTSGTANYRYAGPNLIDLLLSSLGESANITNRFTITSPFPECVNDGNYILDNGVLLNTLGSNPVACDRVSPGCCPSRYVCQPISRFGRSYCTIPNCANEFYGNNQRIAKCDDYNYVNASESERRSQCQNDCPRAKESDPMLNLTRSNLSIGETLNGYGCVWNSVNKTCGFYANVTKKRIVPGLGEIWTPLLSWTEISDYGECINGKQVITYCTKNVTSLSGLDANGVTNSCLSTGRTVINCASGKVELPFFGVINTIFSLIAIAFIYIIFHKREL